MTRRPLISGNWKMNLNHYEAIQTVQKLHYLVPKEVYEEVDISIHPPFTDLRSVQTVIESEDLDFHLGAQHLSLIHISEPTRRACRSRMPSSA